MGHSWREMDAEGAERHDEEIGKLLKIRKELESVPMDAFRAADIMALYAVMDPMGDGTTPNDIALVEKRIAEWRQEQRTISRTLKRIDKIRKK